jgi:hypothetical protein
MNTMRTTLRWIITAGLVLSLSTTAAFPNLVLRGRGEAVVAANRSQRACCCGTADARCCGMACCQMPNRQQDDKSTAVNTLDDRGQPLSWVHSNAASAVTDVPVSAVRAGNFVVAAGASLIALSVRLNT